MNIAPALHFVLADDDDVGEQIKVSERPAKTNRLLNRVIHRGLHHEKVQIAVRARVTSSVGAAQEHLRLRRRRGQAAGGLGYQSLVEYGVYASASIRPAAARAPVGARARP